MFITLLSFAAKPQKILEHLDEIFFFFFSSNNFTDAQSETLEGK